MSDQLDPYTKVEKEKWNQGIPSRKAIHGREKAKEEPVKSGRKKKRRRWRSPRYIGLECKDSILKMVELQHYAGGYAIRQCGVSVLPPGVIEQGRVEDSGALVDALQALLDNRKFRTKRVHLALGSHNIMLRPMKLPNVRNKELRAVVRTEIETNIELPFEEPVFDVIPLNREHTPPGKEMDAMLVMAPRQIIMDYVSILKECKLKPMSVDLAPLAQKRSADWGRERAEQETIMTVNISEQGVDVAIFHNGIIRLTRNIPLQMGSEGTLNLPDQRPNELQQLDVYVSETELEQYAAELEEELERVLNFYLYTLNHREQRLDEMLLTGEHLNFHYLKQRMEERFQVAATVDSLEPFDVDEKTEEEIQRFAVEFITPVGLAMKGADG